MTIRGLPEFLHDYPGMTLRPVRTGAPLSIEGTLGFSANNDVIDSYKLKVTIDATFPNEPPKVIETGGRIPRDGRYHVNPDDTLCLGSPLRLRKLFCEAPDLVSFAERCLVPYLYRVSKALQRGEPLAGLAHGVPGIIEDYSEMFRLKSPSQVVEALRLSGTRRRIANKQPCPCGCGRRLGRCPLHIRLNGVRGAGSRLWFKEHAREIEAFLLRSACS